MVELRDNEPSEPRDPWSRLEAVYATALFLTAVTALLIVTRATSLPIDDATIEPALFFLLFGLLTITIGYHDPNFGYYSFDRVAQVASILVLGPLAAAWVNGTASFLYPWHRLRNGVPARAVALAALHNAGLMALIILICGSLYASLGGVLPLTDIDGRSAMLLIVLVISMQSLNDFGMFALMKAAGRDTTGFFQPFSLGLELGSGAAAVLVALVYNSMSTEMLVLLLGVLSLGMLALRQFANMRLSLEQIVAERTQRLEEKTRELELLATQDNLTGLFNRRYADAFLEQRVMHAGRNPIKLTIALADIDLFKRINDAHSHAIGDEVLRTVADTLRDRCRKTDMIARYGGEEFLICFPDTGLPQARGLCDELRDAVERREWACIGLDSSVTISFGLAEWQPEQTAGSLIHKADLQLYAAKKDGRNRVVA